MRASSLHERNDGPKATFLAGKALSSRSTHGWMTALDVLDHIQGYRCHRVEPQLVREVQKKLNR